MKVIILAGGSGTRLWPLSREFYPKQFLKFKELKNKSLFQLTFQRALKITDNLDDILVITNENHKFLVMGEIEELGYSYNENNIIVESCSKDTLNAIGLGIERIGDDESGLFLSSDCLIKDDTNLINSLDKAQSLAYNSLVLFGISPTIPHTGYGYINYDLDSFDVLDFKEKPNESLAKEYIESGYLWNAGMFLFNKKVFLSELSKVDVSLSNLIRDKNLFENFNDVKKNSVDYGLLEKSSNISVVPLDLEWNDLGSFDAISEEFLDEFTNDSNLVLDGNLIEENSNNNFVKTDCDKVVGLCDVDDLLIVDSDDALMICKKSSSGKIKQIVNKLKESNDERLKFHTTVYRPWGYFKILDSSKTHKVKRLSILPGKSISLQSHTKRSEHWVVVSGEAYVLNGEKEFVLKQNESVYIPAQNKHKLSNNSDLVLEIIETQTGEYFGEDDIIRYEYECGREN